MPKGHRSIRSQGFYRASPIANPTTATYAPISSRPSASTMPNNYYSSMPQSYAPQPTYPSGGPVQHPLASTSYTNPLPPAPLASIRPSSGAWNPQDDQTLMNARAQGMNWAPIQQAYFPTKTSNACRKRHERLMERRSADDWDGQKLETLAKNYMSMRREIWSGLAAATGEKWSTVEAKCLSHGLKNLQQAARSHARRERMLDPSHSSLGESLGEIENLGAYSHTDDSGIGIDELDGAEYDADGASDHSGSNSISNSNASLSGGPVHMGGGGGGGGGGMGMPGSMGGGAGNLGGPLAMGYYAQHGGQHQHRGYNTRLPSMDMGIDAIINRPGGGR